MRARARLERADRRNQIASWAKRLFDIAASLVLIVLFAPVIATIALMVRVKLGSPVLFVQERPGLHGKIFRLFKIRTMLDRRDDDGVLLSDGERLTRFGRFLRSTSLDELPELFNVLRGDMSLVGPRPLLVQYLALYAPAQLRRHDVRPGITGLAQINGRNGISWEERFEYDLQYIENWSFWLDLKILVKTVGKVLRRYGVAQPGHATVEYFRGTALDEGPRGERRELPAPDARAI